MNRTTIDRTISTAGLVVAIALLAASGGLSYAHNFVHKQVHDQLAAEKITFPVSGSEGLMALPASDQAKVSQYAGQQLLTGAQAKVFADNYIAVHLKKIGAGKTYSELSTASLADPSDQKLAGQVATVFRGETLRGLLLNAYAFDTMALVANYAALGALIAGLVLLVLAMLGFYHSSYIQKPAKRRK